MDVLDIIINEPFSSTKTKLETLGLVVKEYPKLDLYLVKYDKNKSDMENSDVKMCRGLIAKMSNNELVCLPPPKSCELHEIYNSIEQWDGLSVEDFLDGTMINLFFHNDIWMISTRSNIGANCTWIGKKTFSEMFNEACSLDFSSLDTSKFYTFVLMHPENIIVTQYHVPEVVLVSSCSVLNGKVEYHDIYKEPLIVKKPIRYSFNNMSEIKDFVIKMDYQKQGIVIKNQQNKRVKIRNENYNYAKSLKGNSNNTKFLYYENKKYKHIKEYLSFFPQDKQMYSHFNSEFIKVVKDTLNYYRLYHIKKKITIKQIPFQLRPVCYKLHGMFIIRQKPIQFDDVYNYISGLDSAHIVFILKPNRDVDNSYISASL
jgi:hypothetical protein